MEKKKKEYKYCPFRLTNEPRDCPGWSQMTPEKRHDKLITDYGCLEKECQWWWMCSGEIAKQTFISIEATEAKLVGILGEIKYYISLIKATKEE